MIPAVLLAVRTNVFLPLINYDIYLYKCHHLKHTVTVSNLDKEGK